MELQRVRRPEGPQDWEAQRPVIKDLYITKGLELEQLMEIMEEEHFFKATKKQYKTYFTKWDLRKNIRPSEYKSMIKKRREREEEGKGSAFRLRGNLIDDLKIVRYEKKIKRSDEHEIVEAGTPEDLSYFTPSPITSSPNAPSPVSPHCQPHDLLPNPNISPFKQDFFIRDPLCLADWTLDESTPVELDCKVLWTSLSLTLRIDAKDPEVVDDIIKVMKYAAGYSDKQFTYSSITLSTPSSPVVYQKGLEPASTASGYKNFSLSFGLKRMTTSSDVRDSVSRISILLSGIWDQRVITLPDKISKDREQMRNSRRCINLLDRMAKNLEQMRNSLRGRSVSCESIRTMDPFQSDSITKDMEQISDSLHCRSASCESMRSMQSFQSDSVIDWKELLYGYNLEAASKEREC